MILSAVALISPLYMRGVNTHCRRVGGVRPNKSYWWRCRRLASPPTPTVVRRPLAAAGTLASSRKRCDYSTGCEQPTPPPKHHLFYLRAVTVTTLTTATVTTLWQHTLSGLLLLLLLLLLLSLHPPQAQLLPLQHILTIKPQHCCVRRLLTCGATAQLWPLAIEPLRALTALRQWHSWTK